MAHKLTALTAQKHNPQRVNVYLDGEFAFGLARIVAAWLEIGQELSDEKIAQLQAEDGRETAYQRALKLLNYRIRSESEVRKNLKEHEIAEEDIEHVIERLKRSGLLNDQAFAQAWVENRSEMRPRSRRALAYELSRRGVDSQVIEQSLEGVDEEGLAYQAAQKRSRKLHSTDWNDFRTKMYRFLAQRGFQYDTIREVTARTWAEMTDANNAFEEEEEEVSP